MRAATNQNPPTIAAALAQAGLTVDPFRPEPDVAFFYPSLGHRDCLERLGDAIRLGGGLGLVTGDAGLGKTMLLQALLRDISAEAEVTTIVIDESADARTDIQLLRAMLVALEVEPRGRTGLELSSELNQQIAMHARENRPIRILIDDAHLLTSSQLELLRSLLSFAPAPESLGIILFGEPALREKVDRKRNLAQRVIARHTLNPVNRRDLAHLIEHRLATAGYPSDAPALFTSEAMAVLYRRSGGAPGATVGLARTCLAAAALLGRNQIDATIAQSAERQSLNGQMQARLPFHLNDMTGASGA